MNELIKIKRKILCCNLYKSIEIDWIDEKRECEMKKEKVKCV